MNTALRRLRGIEVKKMTMPLLQIWLLLCVENYKVAEIWMPIMPVIAIRIWRFLEFESIFTSI